MFVSSVMFCWYCVLLIYFQIYALNKVMTELENSRFKEFCAKKGIKTSWLKCYLPLMINQPPQGLSFDLYPMSEMDDDSAEMF